MTEPLFEVPGDTLLARASADPIEQLQLSRAERDHLEVVTEQSHTARTLVEVGLVLGAAFLLYRHVVARKTRDEVTPQTNSRLLQWLANRNARNFVPGYIHMAVPALETAYSLGMVKGDNVMVPDEMITQFAENYAVDIMKYINESSADALTEGFNAYVNKKLPLRMAAEKALEGYGLTSRQMRALVGKAARNKVDSVVELDHDATTRDFIEMMLVQRAHDIGDNEGFNVTQHGQQLSWLWLQKMGRLSPFAQKRWITAEDERVCPACGPLDKKEVLVKEAFETEYGKLWVPSMHPNCRCQVRLHIPEEADAALIPDDGLTKQSNSQVAKADDDDWLEREHPRGTAGRFVPKQQAQRQPSPQVAERPIDPELERLLREVQPAAQPQVAEEVDDLEELERLLGEVQAEKAAAAKKIGTSGKIRLRPAEEGKIRAGRKIRAGEGKARLGQQIKLGGKIMVGEPAAEPVAPAAEKIDLVPEKKIKLGEPQTLILPEQVKLKIQRQIRLAAPPRFRLERPKPPTAPESPVQTLPHTMYYFDTAGFHFHEQAKPVADAHESYVNLSSQHLLTTREEIDSQQDAIFRGEIRRRAEARWNLGLTWVGDEDNPNRKMRLGVDAVEQVMLAEVQNMRDFPQVRDWARQMDVRREDFELPVYETDEVLTAGFSGDTSSFPQRGKPAYIQASGKYLITDPGVVSDHGWPIRWVPIAPDVPGEKDDWPYG